MVKITAFIVDKQLTDFARRSGMCSAYQSIGVKVSYTIEKDFSYEDADSIISKGNSLQYETLGLVSDAPDMVGPMICEDPAEYMSLGGEYIPVEDLLYDEYRKLNGKEPERMMEVNEW